MMKKLSHMIKASVFMMGIAVFALAPAAQALADGGYNKRSKHYSNNNHNYQGRSHRTNYNYRRHNDWRASYNYNYNYRRHNNWRSHYSYNNHGGEVALGILAGGLMFYALTANQRNTETVYVQQQPVYVQPQQQWTQQQPVSQPQNLAQNTASSCLQVREYQTTITVGNQTVPAYGQSCLQPDGSWKLGPAIPEPGY